MTRLSLHPITFNKVSFPISHPIFVVIEPNTYTTHAITAIKNALKQENLNPEIEEKLLNLQRYQEKQMKTDDVLSAGAANASRHHAASSGGAGANRSHNQSNSVGSSPAAKPPVGSGGTRKRPNQRSPLDDDDWVLDTPKRRVLAAGTSGTNASGANVAGANVADRTAGSASNTPTKRVDTSAETSPATPAPPVNKRSLAAKKRESDKKKAALAANVSIPLF